MPSDYTTVSVTLAVGATPTLLFPGRPARKCLIVSGALTGTTFVGTGPGDFTNKVFLRVLTGTTQIMPIRDFGPLITGEIWVTNTINGNSVNGAEVYEVGKARR